MRQPHDSDESLPMDERTTAALQLLGSALDTAGMSARVRLSAANGTSVAVHLGRDASGRSHSLVARPAGRSASHFRIYDDEGY